MSWEGEFVFDKRLTEMCPESRKYIVGNVVLQFLELCLNAAMIVTIALAVQNLYDGTWGPGDLVLPVWYSDNYFFLMPGESREVEVEAPGLQGRLRLCAEGMNI